MSDRELPELLDFKALSAAQIKEFHDKGHILIPDVLDASEVLVYKDVIIEAADKFNTENHYWPVNTNNTITMWMPLIDITGEMGMLTFASGSHKSGFVGNVAISDESDQMLEQFIKNNGLEVARSKSMKAGDASWHYGWTLHSAPGNASPDTRPVMTIIYIADGAKVTEPQNEHQENDRQKWFCGLNPGDLAASELNPLVL